MSLARAFTMRSLRTPAANTTTTHDSAADTAMATSNGQNFATPVRASTLKGPGRTVDRRLISGPMFMHTTNTLALSAPDVATVRALRKASSSVSSGSSRGTADDSDASSLGRRSRDTQLTDASSVENSPSGSPNIPHSESYFPPKARVTSTLATSRRSKSSVDLRASSRISATGPIPEIPRRPSTQIKDAHEILRKRSLQNTPSAQPTAPQPVPQQQQHQQQQQQQQQQSHSQPTPFHFSSRQRYQNQPPRPKIAPTSAPMPQPQSQQQTLPSTIPEPQPQPQPQQASQLIPREQRVSIDMFNSNIDLTSHPFGAELEQLAAIAGEFTNLDKGADMSIMRERKLGVFRADDYILEIQPLFQRCFGTVGIRVDPVGGWI